MKMVPSGPGWRRTPGQRLNLGRALIFKAKTQRRSEEKHNQRINLEFRKSGNGGPSVRSAAVSQTSRSGSAPAQDAGTIPQPSEVGRAAAGPTDTAAFRHGRILSVFRFHVCQAQLSKLSRQQCGSSSSGRMAAAQITLAWPVPLVTSPMIQAVCFVPRMYWSTVSAWSAATMVTMPTPMLKT